MTTFAEMETLVAAQTRRPDISAVTKAAIKSATLRAHHTDFFPRDLQTAALTYTPLSTAIFYDFPNINNTLTRLRSLKFVQSNEVTGTPTESLEYRTADDIYDSDGNRRLSIYTLIGATLRVYPQSATGYMTAYFYENPNTAEVGYSSWIADTYPDELAMWAAGIVFARTGFLEAAKQYQDEHVKPFKEMLIDSHLLGTVA
jgi:hypothetical protein